MTPRSRTKRSRLHRILLWTSIVLAVLIAATIITGDIVLHRVGPIIKARVLATLSARFDSRVELAAFHVSTVRGFEISGDGLKLWPNHLAMPEPLIQVDHFSFHILGWQQLIQTPNYINVVRVSGLEIHIPPKDERAHLPHLGSGTPSVAPPAPVNDENPDQPSSQITVGQILIDHATLVFEKDQPGKQPLTFVIHKLALRSVTAGQPMKFAATLINPKPLGDIATSGDFGPFDAQSPGDTPVDGQYSFTHADLGTIHGIGGILSSQGTYSGQLNRLLVDGATDTPDFHLAMANHPVPLKTTFHAIVDGTSGNTHLEPVDGWLAQTHIVASGDVAHVPGQTGLDITLNCKVGPGRIEDILQLTAKSPPIMNGPVQVEAQIHIPPGASTIGARLGVDGTFLLNGIRFTSPRVQNKVDELSLRGQGQAHQAQQEVDAMKAGNLQAATAANIPSDISGTFVLSSGQIRFSTLDYTVPGAEVKLTGRYLLQSETLDFTGAARLHAHVSQMVTGWKSFVLKAVNPFFAKDGAGTEVPIHITGTRANPQIGLGFH
ncbi:MAG: hypothetical protein WCA44_04385 [Acidobacteriaceae bacterium]